MRKCFVFLCVILSLSVSVNAKEYYVDNTLGSDENSGGTITSAWKTLAKVNESIFSPGDIVRLKKGEVWEEQLNVSSSGIKGDPIVFTAYGNGDSNPVIKLSNSFAGWTLESDSSGRKIWTGKISGVKNSWGAVRNQQRLPRYLGHSSASSPSTYEAPSKVTDMKNGFFYCPLNSGRFYFRFDGGNPGTMEIGSRQHGINITGKKYIVIEGIDVFGPGGLSVSGSSSSSYQVKIHSSENVIIKNCTVSVSHTKALKLVKGSSSCVVENVVCHDHGSTGIYLVNAGGGNIIKKCEVYDTGNIVTDYGDMGCIGFESSGSKNLIDGCYVHDNGYEGVIHIDAAISIFNTPNTTVHGCYVKNSADKAIMFSNNSDYSTASYNIIDNWGVHGSTIEKWPSIEGLRLGGGEGGIIGCKIYNNLFINGSVTKGKYAALTVQDRENAYTKIKNNIFYDVKNVYDIKVQSKDGFKGWEISNNLFFRSEGNSIYWDGIVYDYAHIVGNTAGFFSYDKNQGQNSLVADPKISKNIDGLYSDSPCIDMGADVGLVRDYNGNTVPYGKKVDIGPFEYTGKLIAPPEGLRVE